jgi:DNA-binding PadR family transcriptional regulator
MPRYVMGEFERLVLLTLIRLKDQAYGVAIRQHLSSALGRDVAIGAVYTTLQRLEDKGYVSSSLGEPTAARGGRAKRFFHIEAPGADALTRSERQSLALSLLRPSTAR